MTSAPRSASVVVIAPGPSIEHSMIRTLPSGVGAAGCSCERVSGFGHRRTMMAHCLTTRQKRIERAAPAWTSPSPPTRTPFARPASASTTRSRTASGCGGRGGRVRPDACGTPSWRWACRPWRCPRQHGGAGASLTDLAAAVEVHGAHLGLGAARRDGRRRPAARRRLGDAAAAALAAIVDGAAATLAPAPGRGRRRPSGTRAPPWPPWSSPSTATGSSVADPAGDRRAPHAGRAGRRRRRSRRRADARRGARRRSRAYERAVDEWRAADRRRPGRASARATLDVGVQYAKDRHQFGVPIGSFQALQHRFADLHARVDGGRLLAYEAIWALDEGEPDAPQLAPRRRRGTAARWPRRRPASASTCTAATASCSSTTCSCTCGGPRRRASLLGDPASELRTIAARRWGADAPDRAAKIAAAATARPTRAGMDFRVRRGDRGLPRRGARLHRRAPHPRRRRAGARPRGTMHDWGFHKALCERGYLAAGWPVEVGGLGRSAIDQTLLNQELFGSGAPIDGLSIAAMVGATLLLRGTEQQRNEIVPRILAGEVMCCLGYSEPDAGLRRRRGRHAGGARRRRLGRSRARRCSRRWPTRRTTCSCSAARTSTCRSTRA